MTERTWTCRCKSSWPALTTVEAFRNHQRAHDVHPNQKCEEQR